LIGYCNFDKETKKTVGDSLVNQLNGAGNALNLAGSYIEVTNNVLFNDLQSKMTIEYLVLSNRG
jgi:hypothetical protein